MAYNTGNPIGSTSPKDLSDNARNLDLLLLGDDPSYPDRKGVPRKSWKGMEAEYVADRLRRATEFHTAQTERDTQFKAFLDASGYEAPVPYAPGLTLERATQTVTYLGNEYRVKSQFLPLTTIDWSTDQSKLKLIGDDSLRQALADPIDPANGVGMLGYMGRTLAGHLGDCVNAKDYGMRAWPGFDNRLPLQRAINKARELGLPVWIPGDKREYEIWGSVWKPSTTFLYGDGGVNRLTKLKAMDGHYTDMLIAGEHDEGVDYTEPGRTLKHRNGFPYLSTNIGHDVRVQGIYLDGNGINAGLAPEFPEGSGYRGCNILIRYVDGVTLHDVFSEFAPNDCAQIARCRRISVTDSEFSRNYLVGNVIGGTRNGLTVTGTLSGLGFSTSDFIRLTNIKAEETEDLGVAVQFYDNPEHPTAMSGTVDINGIFTRRNATYGLGVEISGAGVNQPERENINISNVISIEDSRRTGEAYAAVLISHRSRAVNLANVVIRDSGGHGLIFSGSKTIHHSNIHVDGYNLGGFQDIKGIFGYVVGSEVPEVCSMSNVTVKGGAGRGGDTSAVHITGYELINGACVTGDGTTFKTTTDSAAIYLAAKVISMTASHAINSATNGWRLSGFNDLGLTGCTAKNSGRGGGSAQKVGINVGPGTNRTGRITACNSYDDQAIHTQDIGILLGISTTDSITVTGCDASGNINAPLKNLGMPNARIHNNGFPYTGASLPFNIGGNGGYLSCIKMGVASIWVEAATGKLRIKQGTPTSDSDGTVVGTQS